MINRPGFFPYGDTSVPFTWPSSSQAYLNTSDDAPSDTPTSRARALVNGRRVCIGQWLPNFSYGDIRAREGQILFVHLHFSYMESCVAACRGNLCQILLFVLLLLSLFFSFLFSSASLECFTPNAWFIEKGRGEGLLLGRNGSGKFFFSIGGTTNVSEKNGNWTGETRECRIAVRDNCTRIVLFSLRYDVD